MSQLNPKQRGKISYACLVGKYERLACYYCQNDYFECDEMYIFGILNKNKTQKAV